ncbi:MAG: S-layer homology domain-containing protein [Acidimicrobiales bacterium]|nr:S-layer homology domain-containing protein [Acidimicrobiales bacterium]
MGRWGMKRRTALALVVALALVTSSLGYNVSAVRAAAGFGDVSGDAFYAAPVAWMAAEEITKGTATGCFSPSDPTTRAQAATFIHRYAGEPAAAPGSASFFDVTVGGFYDPAVGWMVAEKITTGTSPTTFSPDRDVTRGEFATLLWRYVGSPTVSGLGSSTFDDVTAGAFFDAAVGWMVAEDITTGTSPTTFHPDRNVTRGELATFLWRHAGRPAADTSTRGMVCATTGEREPAAASSALGLLDRLDVATENWTGYDRDLFDHWSDLDNDSCDTRQEVLTAESLIQVTTTNGCRVSTGQWLSTFDNVIVTDPSALDIDHLVPLAEAWDSGASGWDHDTRERFANDQDDARALIAVSASSNRSKSDRDPAEWLPPHQSYRCTYASDWVVVKTRWSLSIDTSEKAALTSILADCPAPTIEVEIATIGGTSNPPSTTTTTTTTVPPSCHPAYSPCLPNLAGDALNCGDLTNAQKPVTVLVIGVDPYNLDGNNDGVGCSS